MRTEDIPNKPISMWIPEKDPETLALVGKLGEECCELGARLFRAAIQGFDAADPDDGKSNAEHIWDEVADVEAMISHLKDRRASYQARIEIDRRADRKFGYKLPWLDFLKGPSA